MKKISILILLLSYFGILFLFDYKEVNALSYDFKVNSVTTNAYGDDKVVNLYQETYSTLNYALTGNITPSVNRPFQVFFGLEEPISIKAGNTYSFVFYFASRGGYYLPNYLTLNQQDFNMECTNLPYTDVLNDNTLLNTYVALSCHVDVTFKSNVNVSQFRVIVAQSNTTSSKAPFSVWFRERTYYYSNDKSNDSIQQAIDTQTQQQHDDALTQQELQKEQTEATNKQTETITDTKVPDVDVNGLTQLVPKGPIDSILNLPLTMLNDVKEVFTGHICEEVDLPIPFINKTITLPCINDIYDKIGLGSLITLISGIISGYILFKYLISLYKWVDDVLTFRENNWIDM